MQSWHPASNVIHLVYVTVIKALIGRDGMRLVGPCLGLNFRDVKKMWVMAMRWWLSWISKAQFCSILYTDVFQQRRRYISHFPIYNRPSVLGVLFYPGWYHGPLVIHQRYVYMLLERASATCAQFLRGFFGAYGASENSETSRLYRIPQKVSWRENNKQISRESLMEYLKVRPMLLSPNWFCHNYRQAILQCWVHLNPKEHLENHKGITLEPLKVMP